LFALFPPKLRIAWCDLIERKFSVKLRIKILFVALPLFALPAVVRAQFSYITNNNTITITEYTGSDEAVVIPATIDGYPVTDIGDYAFQYNSGLANVSIPDSVITIGYSAFYKCGLTNVIIPNSVTAVGSFAFQLCGKSQNAIIGNSVTNIGEGVFSDCYSLTNITVDASNPAYSGSNGILFDKAQTTLVQFPCGRSGNFAIPNNVTNIGNGAFYDCLTLTGITFPNGLIRIGTFAFYKCGLTNSVVIPNSVISVGESAFQYCQYLKNATIGNNLTSLEQYVFGDCQNLNTVLIGNGVASIGYGAFENDFDVTGVTIPNNVTNIGVGAFYECGLTSLTVPNSVVNIGQYAFGFCDTLTTATLGSGVIRIEDNAFWKCFGLTNVTVNSGVIDYIGQETFSSCTSLTRLTLGSSVTNIENMLPLVGHFALTNFTVNAVNPVYSSLNGVLFDKAQTILIQFPLGRNGGYVIPNNVISVETLAFQNEATLASLTIGNSVTNFPAEEFSGCWGLTNISVNAANLVYSSLNGILFNKAQTILIRFPLAQGGSYLIPNSVNRVGETAFEGCSALTQLTVPGNVNSIGTNAFAQCYGLSNVNLGNGIVDIGSSAFANCWRITNIIIPDSVITIGSEAFSGCFGIVNVTLGNGLTELGYRALSSCEGVTNFTVNAANPVYSSSNGILFNKSQTTLIQFPAGRVGSYFVPNNVLDIGDDAFSECELTNVVIGSGVTNIGSYAFVESVFLISVTIPASVISIGSHAFEACHSLISAYFAGNAPPDDGTAFYADNTGANFVYYLTGTTGWNPTFGGLPAVLWNPKAQGAGMIAGHFGFGINGPPYANIVVEACTNISHPTWIPLSTNTLSDTGASTFSDPKSGNYPFRYYRFRSP
jgi:hypothetical protein